MRGLKAYAFLMALGICSLLQINNAGATVILDPISDINPLSYRSPMCIGNTAAGFASRLDNVRQGASNPDRIFYNVQIKWKKCTKQETRAYAIFGSPEWCPLSGTYGGGGNSNAYDCAKYVGSKPRFAGPNGLKCTRNPDTLNPWNPAGPRYDDKCTTSRFGSIDIAELEPGAEKSDSFPNSFQLPNNWERRNDSYEEKGRLCQFFKYGANYKQTNHSPNEEHCIRMSIRVSWRVVWNVTASTTRDAPTGGAGVPGQAYKFTHVTRNADAMHRTLKKNNTNQSIKIQVQQQVNNGVWTNLGNAEEPSVLQRRGDSGDSYAIEKTGNLPASFVPGSKYCQRITVSPRTESGDTTVSTPQCIEPSMNFELVPQVSAGPSAIEAGETITATPMMQNTGVTPSSVAEWQLVRYSVAPGGAIVTGSTGTGSPCGYYTNGCNVVSSGTATFGTSSPINVTKVSGDDFSERSYDAPEDAQLGSKICFATAVKPHATTAPPNQWRYGVPQCVVVGIKPRLNVLGHDLKAVGGISTSVSRLGTTAKTYGSYGEYGVFSGGPNARMGSGSALNGGANDTSQEAWSPLTFANKYRNPSNIVSSRFGTYAPFELPTVSANGAFVRPGPVSMMGLDLTRPVVKVNGTLTIADNLTYGKTFGSIKDIPRVVLIADDVIINSNVTQIDPWIVAKRISTCSDARVGSNYFVKPKVAKLYSGICSNSLTFNGPVITDELYLHRTTNSGTNTTVAAETFNLRADAFLSSLGRGTGAPVATIDAVSELPPRF